MDGLALGCAPRPQASVKMAFVMPVARWPCLVIVDLARPLVGKVGKTQAELNIQYI